MLDARQLVSQNETCCEPKSDAHLSLGHLHLLCNEPQERSCDLGRHVEQTLADDKADMLVLRKLRLA